jgi:hypothetical protein
MEAEFIKCERATLIAQSIQDYKLSKPWLFNFIHSCVPSSSLNSNILTIVTADREPSRCISTEVQHWSFDHTWIFQGGICVRCLLFNIMILICIYCTYKSIVHRPINTRPLPPNFWGHHRASVCTECLNKNSVALVRKGTILTERPPLVGKVSANFCG